MTDWTQDSASSDRTAVHRALAIGGVDRLSGGRLAIDIPVAVAVDGMLVNEPSDRVVSIGQVVPHEVIGMANFTKNLVIGLGGAPTVHRSHFLGAFCDMNPSSVKSPTTS